MPNLIFGISEGMSHLYNISWSYEFTRLLRGGDLYPRWLDGLNGGVGSLAFWIYAPLPFYVNALSGGLLCSSCEPTTQVAIGEWLLLAGSGLAFYALVRRYASGWPALLGALFYMLAPYHFEIDLWSRQAIGEFAAYVWMPLVVLNFQAAVARERRAFLWGTLAYAALVFSHLPAAVLFSLGLALLALLHVFWERSVRPLLILGGMVALGLGLAAIYLLPALTIQAIDVYSQTKFHFWHYYANWFFLDGKADPDPGFGARLQWIWLSNTVATVLLFFAAGGLRDDAQRRQRIWWLAASALVAFMVTPPSTFVWELLPFLQQVQFPWRIMILTDLALAMLGAMALAELAARPVRWRQGAVIVTAVMLGLFGARHWRAFQNVAMFYGPAQIEGDRLALQVGTDTPEYLPMWVHMDQSELIKQVADLPRAAVIGGAGTARDVRWDNRLLQIQVSLPAAGEVEVRQVYVPWWRASIEGREQSVPVTPAPQTGLVRLQLPAGEYTVRLKLMTPPIERTGQAISAAAALVVLCLLWVSRRRGGSPANAVRARTVAT